MKFIASWQRFDVSAKGPLWALYALAVIALITVLQWLEAK